MAVLPSIAKWLGEAQHKEAFTLKQMRLWTEERAAMDKKRGNNNAGKNGARGNE